MKTAKSIFGVLNTTLGLRGRICTSSLGPLLLLLLMLPVSGAQAAVVFTTLYSFTGTNDGANPVAGLVQGSDGNFYGTTSGGGTNNVGTVFKISANGVLTSLYSFTGTNDGANPVAGLVQGSDGNFYGTTLGGGTNGGGSVFKISANGALTSLYSFSGGNDGANPQAALVQGSDGYFYGTTSGGGTNNTGTVFKISTNGALTTLYAFWGTDVNGLMLEPDGGGPNGLVQGSDGYLYGTTLYGGDIWNQYDESQGTVFKISPTGALTTLHAFGSITNASGVALDGANPVAALVQGSDGYFYGTTFGGGFGVGTVFKISRTGVLTSLYSFSGGSKDGEGPEAGLVQGSDGNFYGTASGYYNHPELPFLRWPGRYSTVFQISTNGALMTLYNFGTNQSDEEFVAPTAGLVQGSDGSLNGTTSAGGTYGYGIIFRLTIVPGLSIIPSGPYVILTWPTNYAGFSYAGYTLQSTTNLGSSAVWSTNSSPPVVIGGQNVVINTMSGRQQFYRLSQ